MRYLILLAALLGAAQAQAWMSPAVGGGRATAGVGGGGGTNPDWAAALDDNAANAVITADYGSDGQMRLGVANANTNTVYSADGPSFSLTDDQHLMETAQLDYTAFEDEDFAIQFDMKSSTSFSANFERVWANDNSETKFMANTNSDTAMTIYVGGTSEGSFAVDDMADGTWKTYRIVVATGDTKTVVVYQGANEASLVEKSSTTSPLSAVSLGANFRMRFAGNTGANKTRVSQWKNLKVWYSSVNPGE